MMWQFVVSLAVLRHELGGLRWPAVKERIWLNLPRDPRTGRARKRVVRVGRAGDRGQRSRRIPGHSAGHGVDRLAAGPARAVVHAAWRCWPTRSSRASGGFSALALTSLVFNYILGEELLFRGVLLPRMAGVFGRWDWVANTVLFGLYHVHKIWFWPSMIASSFGYAWAAKRYRSFWMGVIVHGVEGYFIVLVVAVILGWYP